MLFEVVYLIPLKGLYMGQQWNDMTSLINGKTSLTNEYPQNLTKHIYELLRG